MSKLEPNVVKCFSLGYSDEIKRYKLWDVENKKCVISRVVTFKENVTYMQQLALLKPYDGMTCANTSHFEVEFKDIIENKVERTQNH